MRFLIYSADRIKWGLLFFISVFCFKSVAQNAIWNINSTSGLSNDYVQRIVKDSKGFMWLATYDGLNRFDGDQFEIFRHDPADPNSLAGNLLLGLYAGEKNTLWIATTHGACRYQYVTKQMTRIEYASDCKSPNPENTPVIDFAENNRGDVFMTVMEQGIFVCRNGEKTARHIPIKDQSKVINSYFTYNSTSDTQGRIWFFADRIGLCRIDPGAESAVVISKTFYYTWFMKTGPDGNIWFGGDFGLIIYNTKSGRFQRKSDIRLIRDICFDKRRTVWMAVENKGVYSGHLHGDVFKLHTEFDQSPEFTKSIVSIFIDEQDLIWLGTKNDGICVINKATNPSLRFISHFLYGGNTKLSKLTTALEEDKAGNIWVGTHGAGVKRWNRDKNTFDSWTTNSTITSLSGDVVQDILCDSKGQIWVATFGGGICRYDPFTDTFQRFRCYNAESGKNDEMALSLYEDSSGRIWAGFQDGRLSVMEKEVGAFKMSDIGVMNVFSIFEDIDGTFWFGTDHYLVHANKKTRSISFNRIGAQSNAIYRDSLRQLWIGTAGGLLLLGNQKRRSIRYTKAHGLCDNNIVSLTPAPDGKVWISTMNGISMLDPATKKIEILSEYDRTPFPKFSRNAALKLRSGDMAFGGNEGFYLFKPFRLTTRQRKLSPQVTRILVSGKPIEAFPDLITGRNGDGIREITIPYDKADLTVDFVTPEFIMPRKVVYSYLLEGFDKSWSARSNIKSARYSNLPDGTYFFRIRTGFDANPLEREQQMVKITVLPPWYRTWWAYTLYTLLLAAFIFLIVRFFWLRTMLRYEHALYQAKLDFFTNIAHEVRTHIMLILGPVEMILSKNYNESRTRSGLTSVKSNGERLLRLVNELLDFRKAEVSSVFLQVKENELVSFLRDIYGSFSQLSQSNEITFEFMTKEEKILVPFDPDQLEKVIFNLLVNAFKFTPRGGKIELSVASGERFVDILVKDNGKGIAPENLKNLFVNFFQVNELGIKNSGFGIGLALSKKIVEQHGGTLTVQSTPGKNGRSGGSVFTVRLSKAP